MDTPRKIKLGGIILRTIRVVWFTPNHKPSKVVRVTPNHKPNPKPNIFQSNNHTPNNNNTSMSSLICNKEGTLLKGILNKFKTLMVDINSLYINTFDLAFINHSHSWQPWICQICSVILMT